MTRFADLFTNRQLLALTTFSDLVMEARERVLARRPRGGRSPGDRLEAGGTDAEAYADAVATYLGLCMSQVGRSSASSIVTVVPEARIDRNTFARQAIPMAWDFVEPNPFADGAGSWAAAIDVDGGGARRCRAARRSSAPVAGRCFGARLSRRADLHRPAVLRQHRLLRPLRLLLRLAAPLAAQRPSRTC